MTLPNLVPASVNLIHNMYMCLFVFSGRVSLKVLITSVILYRISFCLGQLIFCSLFRLLGVNSRMIDGASLTCWLLFWQPLVLSGALAFNFKLYWCFVYSHSVRLIVDTIKIIRVQLQFVITLSITLRYYCQFWLYLKLNGGMACNSNYFDPLITLIIR